MAITDIRAAHSALRFVIHLKLVASDMDIARRIWHLDFMLFELIVNGKVKLTGELASTLYQSSGPGTQFEIESIVTETYEPDTRRRGFQNLVHGLGGLKQCLFNLTNIRIERNADRNSKPHSALAMRPVHHVFRDQFRIGNDDVYVVVC